MIMLKKIVIFTAFVLSVCGALHAQVTNDSVNLPTVSNIVRHADTALRIINLYPYFSLHVDSNLSYRLQINKPQKNYYWFLKDAPSGLRIDKDEGTLSFKSNKSLFMSGRLKYDTKYPVQIGVQSLSDPHDRVDTSFTISFYSTDIIFPRIKPSVVSPVYVEEGSKLSFNVLCDNGNFAIERILVTSNISIGGFKLPKSCDDTFEWTPGYDFVGEKDSGQVKIVNLVFIGTTQFNFTDTARVKVIVRNALNFDIATREYNDALENMNRWLLRYKYTFLQLDKKLKSTKTWRSGFDITTATTTTTGTVISTTVNNNKVATPKVLAGAGALAIPIREAAVPSKTVEQNQAGQLRANIKRLEYVVFDCKLSGDRDPNIASKTETLKKELRQSQAQLGEVPTEMAENMSEEQINKYFNSSRVQRKYRLK
ncbi:hypothetical protein [Niabella drilacis]|uniref:Uncharacterized protein n=1 Tax=Niabella drilacis (strain DSM 25811 / CCM 8410 / CCUG 62505 / LMG 26954 / E90) TaxID=1285928 RepID=A0A1G6IEW2_NIADE|nr:hypothetical protein [Niabella drilacis]SDC05097.1 hypothetical protein SAMN04487894_101201 [Niabella drilacis]